MRFEGEDENPGHWDCRKQRKRVLYPGGKEAVSNGGLRDDSSDHSYAIGVVLRLGNQHNPAIDSGSTVRPV